MHPLTFIFAPSIEHYPSHLHRLLYMKEFRAFRYIKATKQSLEVTLSPQSQGLVVTRVTGERDDVDYADLELMFVGYLDSHANFKQLSTGDSFICLEFRL